MFSPHVLRLAFVLLALVAPRPNIAVSSNDPDEGTEDSVSGQTRVTVYHCKDCERTICQSGTISFEPFKKIAETKNRFFSNGIFELETTETNITMCLLQGNSFPEGIYGIIWENTEGHGIICGNLNSGDFSQNGRGNISTEEMNICCEAKRDMWKYISTLWCYTQRSRPKPNPPPADIPGNPEILPSKKNSIGILFPFLFAGLCTGWGTMYYCLKLQRGQAYRQDGWAPDTENLTHV